MGGLSTQPKMYPRTHFLQREKRDRCTIYNDGKAESWPHCWQRQPSKEAALLKMSRFITSLRSELRQRLHHRDLVDSEHAGFGAGNRRKEEREEERERQRDLMCGCVVWIMQRQKRVKRLASAVWWILQTGGNLNPQKRKSTSHLAKTAGKHSKHFGHLCGFFT